MMQLIIRMFLKALPFLRKLFSKTVNRKKSASEILQGLYSQHKGEWNPKFNLFGIRNRENPKADKFDDWIGCHYIDDDGKDQVVLFQGTTDPGLYWSKHTSRGVFHMGLGFQKDIWVWSKHWNRYKALCQRKGRSGKVYGWRDTNRNLKRDPTDKEVTTKESINLHRASVRRAVEKIGKYGGGCQVVRLIKDYLVLMGLAEESELKKFSYMLFGADQVPLSFRHNLLAA